MGTETLTRSVECEAMETEAANYTISHGGSYIQEPLLIVASNVLSEFKSPGARAHFSILFF